MVVFTTSTFALLRALDRIVITYVGFQIQQESKKLEKKLLLIIISKSCTKAIKATRKRTVSSVVSDGCWKLPSNVILDSDFDCNSHIKNGLFHQFDICAIIERT